MKIKKLRIDVEKIITEEDGDQIGDVLARMTGKVFSHEDGQVPKDICFILAIEMLIRMLQGFKEYEAENLGFKVEDVEIEKGPLQ